MKKITALLGALTLLCGLAACTDGGADSTAPTEAPTKTVYVHSSVTQEFGSTVSRTEYIFDEANRVKEVIVYTNGAETKRHSVACDENGNYIRWTADGSVTEYAYDEEGHIILRTMTVDGSTVSSTSYTWENGLRTCVTTKMGDMTQTVLMTYTAAGALLRQDTYAGDNLTSYCIYAPEVNGRTKTMSTFNPDGSLQSIAEHQWEGSAQTITTTAPDGTVTQIAVLTYDDAGNLLTHEVYDGQQKLISKETHTWKAIEVDPDCPRASV